MRKAIMPKAHMRNTSWTNLFLSALLLSSLHFSALHFSALPSGAAAAETTAPDPVPYPEPQALTEVRDFLAAGWGRAHPQAPAGLAHFARLVGTWDARPEIRAQDGTWHDDAPALWLWKFTLGGFAIQDLWLHGEQHLPAYLAKLGRAYLLSSVRTFDAKTGTWHSAWAANGGGQGPGMDFGTLSGKEEHGRLVLYGESAYGRQRVIFSDITQRSFLWTSEFSQDGETWTAVMRVHATRRE